MKPQGLDNVVTPLHTAVELDCVEAIQELMELKVSISCLNEAGQTPLHLCVKHKAEVALQVIVLRVVSFSRSLTSLAVAINN